VSLLEFCGMFRLAVPWPPPLISVYQWLAPFRSFNSYGLFAVMTTSRLEIVIEGSDDGKSWREYEFRYKPGDLKRRPEFVAPHQPRLDWQMWFAALSNFQQNPWFGNFCFRLLQGQREVLALLQHNPFPDHPPRYLRAVLYGYHFTNYSARQKTGAWWRRERKGEYMPTLTLPDRSQVVLNFRTGTERGQPCPRVPCAELDTRGQGSELLTRGKHGRPNSPSSKCGVRSAEWGPTKCATKCATK
jgi:hypothetical protein